MLRIFFTALASDPDGAGRAVMAIRHVGHRDIAKLFRKGLSESATRQTVCWMPSGAVKS